MLPIVVKIPSDVNVLNDVNNSHTISLKMAPSLVSRMLRHFGWL